MLLCGLAGSTTGHSSLKPPPPEPRREPGASPTGRRFKARTSLRFMLLAEDLLLLLTDDDTGKLAASSTEVDVALGGALLAELALMDRVDVAGADERVREGRLVVRDANPTADSLLDEALAIVEHKEGKKPKSVVARLGKGLRVRLYDRLVQGGVLRAEGDRVLGIFPTHRWPATDAAHEVSVRTGLATGLRDGATADERTGALVALLHALKVEDKVVEAGSVGLTKKVLNANARRIAEGDWAAKAVRQAIEDTDTAVIAASS
jgi:hypothetical protein